MAGRQGLGLVGAVDHGHAVSQGVGLGLVQAVLAHVLFEQGRGVHGHRAVEKHRQVLGEDAFELELGQQALRAQPRHRGAERVPAASESISWIFARLSIVTVSIHAAPIH